uniref:Homeobox domain-containing protein n=1 Tax=Meloidogyne floridensis TaxID=298350 RepID=A0A915P6N3_9BILA
MISDVSTLESITCKIEWKLYNLDKHGHLMQNDQFLTSKEFYNPKYPSVNWQLRVYPNIWQLDSAGIYVSLVQVGLNDSKPLKAQFNIYTLDDAGNKIFCCPSTTFVFKFGTESDKYQVFKSQTTDKSNDNLENGGDYVLVNDSSDALNLDFLLLYCEVEFVPYNIKCENEIVDFSSESSSQRSLDMFKEGILTDCVVEACVNFLSASKVFLISKEWKEFKSFNKDLAFRLMEESIFDRKEHFGSTVINEMQLTALKREFQVCHYPDVGIQNLLAKKIGLPRDVIGEWFKNERQKARQNSSDKKEEHFGSTVINEIQLTALKREFQVCHYPDVELQNLLAKNLGLPAGVIGEWFKNKRQKAREESSRNKN